MGLSPELAVLSRISIALALAFFTLTSMDPMVVYLMFVATCTALFPSFWLVLGIASLVGVYKIAVKHDPVMGSLGSFLACTAEGIDTTLTGALAIVTVMACLPALGSLFSFSISTISAAFGPVIPLAGLLCTKLIVESQATVNVADTVLHITQYADQAIASLGAIFGIV